MANDGNSEAGRRLAGAVVLLEDIEMLRDYQHDALYGKNLEERLIWSELLELELQEVDEQMERLNRVAMNFIEFHSLG